MAEFIVVDRILTTAKAAQLLGVSVRTVQLWVETGQLESWKTPGGHRRIKLQSVLRLTEMQEGHEFPLTATAVILAGRGRSEAWLEHGLKGSGLQLIVTEIPMTAANWTTDNLPMLIVVEDPEDGERNQLLEKLHRDRRFQSVTIVTVNKKLIMQARSSQTRRLQTSGYGDVKATADELIGTLLRAQLPSATRNFPVPWNEPERLRAVLNSKLLDSGSSREFDSIVRLAAKATASPIAMFTLLTSNEQWFKSRTGFEGQSTPRDWAFCNETLSANELTVFENLAVENRFATNPTLNEPYNFRFYAGAPVRDQNGFALGSICVIDYNPKTLTSEDREALATTADAASNLIQLQFLERKVGRMGATENANLGNLDLRM